MLKPLLTGCTITLLLASCGAVDAVKSSTAKATAGISQLSLAGLLPSRIDVVEVREKDMKEMPLGKDRALAFERKKSFWAFIPGNFKEPDLPEIQEGEPDGGLLPPKPL
jgi:hypothetical protein